MTPSRRSALLLDTDLPCPHSSETISSKLNKPPTRSRGSTNPCARLSQSAASAQLTNPRSPQTPVAAVLAREASKKRKGDSNEPSSKKAKRPPKAAAAPRNTAIYISHLPPSTTPELLKSVFSKAGLILEDADGAPRIKMYTHEDGRFKGEALVVYLKPESVDLAVRLMDETELVLGSGDGVMTVKKAEWEKKAPVEGEGEGGKDASAEGSTAPKGKKGGDAQKQKTARRAEKLLAFVPFLYLNSGRVWVC